MCEHIGSEVTWQSLDESVKEMSLVIRVLLVSSLILAFQEENKLGSTLKCFSMVGLKAKHMCIVFSLLFFFMFQHRQQCWDNLRVLKISGIVFSIRYQSGKNFRLSLVRRYYFLFKQLV